MNSHLHRKLSGQTWVIIGVSVAFLCGLALVIRHLSADPKTVLLTSDGTAQWIRVDEPFDLSARHEQTTTTAFATKIAVPPSWRGGNLQVTAFRKFEIDLDGRQIFTTQGMPENWKAIHSVSIPPNIPAGTHLLRCVVSNEFAPSLLRLKCPELAVATGTTWLARTDKTGWNHAVSARSIWEPANAMPFPSQKMICLGVLFLAGVFICRRQPRGGKLFWPGRVRWFLLLAWLLLGINNVFKVPLLCGYDAQSHYDYILYVADHLSLPRPDAGWQFFQSPLYYIVSAAVCRLLLVVGTSHNDILFLLRWIPLLCAASMIEISYRAAQMVFPLRHDLQILTIVFGGLTPVNLYMGQTVSNEPMAAALSGMVLLMTLRFTIQPRAVRSSTQLAFAGAAIGFALITKINAVLWTVPLGASLALALTREKQSWTAWIKAAAIIALCAAAVSGWLVIRNYRLVGRPFYLESSVAHAQWWQDPGYRTPNSFYEFGHVFTRPIHNVMASVWDSLYGTLWGNGVPSGQPPWNLSLMWCGLWLAIIPTVSIVIGIGRAVFTPTPNLPAGGLRVVVLAVGCFIAAILYVYLTLPVYGCAKASYMMGTTPCLGLLAAAGFDCVPKNQWLRATINAAVICWAVTSYLTYFVVL